jgi:ribosome-associated protein
MIEIASDLSIPGAEVTFRTSRSAGPGGQNVNKVETRVTLLFDLEGSESLSEEQKERVAAALRTRIGKDGLVRVSSQRHRTQRANKDAATERFAELLADALSVPKERRPPRGPSRSAQRRRLQAKRQRSAKKRLRSRPRPDEEV